MTKSNRTRPAAQPTVGADVVRVFMRDPKRLARLTEAGQANVLATRGRLSAEVADAYNKGRKSRVYVPGKAFREATAAREANTSLREAARADGVTVSARGRLPKSLKSIS